MTASTPREAQGSPWDRISRSPASCLFRILVALFVSWGTGYGQTLFPPSIEVEQTRFPVFGDKLTSAELANFRLHLAYEASVATKAKLHEHLSLDLPKGSHVVELTYEHLEGKSAFVSSRLDGAAQLQGHEIPQSIAGANFQTTDDRIRCDRDYTVAATFQTTGNGTLFSRCAPEGKWSPKAKALFIRGGHLVYDIGWLGAVRGGPKVNDGKLHRVVLVVEDGGAEIFVDGKSVAKKKPFRADDVEGHVFKIGSAAPNFGGDFTGGTIGNVRYWSRAIAGAERAALLAGKLEEVNTPDLNWSSSPPVETFSGLGFPGIPTRIAIAADATAFQVNEAWVQPLEIADHANLMANWNEESMAQGKAIYQTLCVTCHGTPEKEGSLPTALKFHEGEFKNGSDPYRLYQTLSKGFGMMVPQPQYTAAQKYAVIQYLREAFLKPHNPRQYFAVTETYLEELPRKLETADSLMEPGLVDRGKQYEKMDFGQALMWTYQVNEGTSPGDWNIAQKGISVRLDAGEGGISKGKAWMIYDEDTMRVATAYTGKFSDWRGIAFDGSHGTHTKIAGEPLFVNPDAPAWQHPTAGHWDDQRIVGRDGRHFGPLPREWVQYRGLYHHGDQVVLNYTVGESEILELPEVIEYGAAPIFVRHLNLNRVPQQLVTRLAPNDPTLNVTLAGYPEATIHRTEDAIELRLPASERPVQISIALSKADQLTIQSLASEARDLEPLTKGGPARFGKTVIETRGELGDESGPFAVDTITIPNASENPWESWMRLGGFDFYAGNPDRAAVCTWLGDVWLVDGLAGDLKSLKWRRICSGLFQPLGLKIVDETIYVTCRDQIARLHDLNGDLEIDHVECFNNDHQVTEHFHEFAMGLQTDEAGNFYYAKSARHAKTAVVPHHGTLLRVSPDGRKTDIVASGFRAANGVCLNPDGTWIVTDQEGHWNPKNRINYVREGGFYGNMFGYHDVTDESDDAMEQPLCWITNAFDRSPAELLWVPQETGWGNLDGVLLNLSYGYGQVYTVPHEVLPNGQAQGGMCAFPIENLPTGLHRGRFHPENNQLYVAGMFAWAGSQREDGGFFRIRATGKPAFMPTRLEAGNGRYTITFSDPVPEGGEFAVKVWDLRRTANYGSKHYNERALEVTDVATKGNQVVLTIPKLQPTWGMEIVCNLSNGEKRVIHSSIHQLPES
mgnify:CR=1 FL=1|tara:strand:- start:83 stop:3628 length:3546 start_codon:yes stop_codon:yes gene_type:complete